MDARGSADAHNICICLLVIAQGEEFLWENLYFPGVLDVDIPPRQADARGSADACRHSRGTRVLVGECVRTLELENVYFLAILVREPVHHT